LGFHFCDGRSILGGRQGALEDGLITLVRGEFEVRVRGVPGDEVLEAAHGGGLKVIGEVGVEGGLVLGDWFWDDDD
jgi:hypothetical protein